MNKKTMLKIILSIIAIASIICISTSAFAEEDEAIDLSGSITSGNTTNTTNSATNTTNNKTNTTNNKTNTTNTTNNTKNNTTSSYTESKIPYAGPAETIIMATLFVACGAVGVYTFIKLSEYSNV